jgi:DNA-dependent RNA polymerase auxiliary subunit epsilon
MKHFLILLAFCFGGIHCCFAQAADTVKPVKDNTIHLYFIISAGDKINAYFNDKPLSAESISEFSEYVQSNIKRLKDSWVVVTGKPKQGTFDDVIKILSRYRFKHVSKNITKD